MTPQSINGKQYSDIDAICQDCGRPFIFTAGEQAFYDEKGFTPPKRCKPCRQANKEDKERQRAERSMTHAPREPRR